MRERGRSRGFLAGARAHAHRRLGVDRAPGDCSTPAAGTKDVGLTGSIPAELPATLEAQGDAVDTTVRVHRYDDRRRRGGGRPRRGDRRARRRRRDDSQWRVQPTSSSRPSPPAPSRSSPCGTGQPPRASTPTTCWPWSHRCPSSSVEIGQVAGRSPDDETAAFIMTLVLFDAPSASTGAMVLSGVVEEKSSRVVEVLLARMPARNLLAGKIAGIGLLGLRSVRRDRARRRRRRRLGRLRRHPGGSRAACIAWAVVWFVLGYALYATVVRRRSARSFSRRNMSGSSSAQVTGRSTRRANFLCAACLVTPRAATTSVHDQPRLTRRSPHRLERRRPRPPDRGPR